VPLVALCQPAGDERSILINLTRSTDTVRRENEPLSNWQRVIKPFVFIYIALAAMFR